MHSSIAFSGCVMMQAAKVEANARADEAAARITLIEAEHAAAIKQAEQKAAAQLEEVTSHNTPLMPQ